eukprot:TRINITY_DN2170_c0_g2_i1.p1 TRINITY_DN2170_c0_g2~~TRINITY_DN2170_c0_g2_i1.p1  ORF type:complete len:855 (+),score=33.80 TRINITY_DN2170_c0_g2_i1:92-2566(+)
MEQAINDIDDDHSNPFLDRLFSKSFIRSSKFPSLTRKQEFEDDNQENLFSHPERLDQAVLLIYQGLLGHYGTHIRHNPGARKAYYYYYHLRWIFSITAALLLVTTFFEPPSWCIQNYGYSTCLVNNQNYRTFNLPIFSNLVAFTVESCILFVLFIEILTQVYIQGQQFKTSALNIAIVSAMLIYVVDLVIAMVIANIGTIKWVRVAPYLRIVIFALRSQTIRQEMWIVVGILGKFLAVLFVMCFVVLIFSLFAVVLIPKVLLGKHNQSDTESQQFEAFTWVMYVVASTDDFDSSLQEDLYDSTIYFFFFILYVVVVIFFLYNLVIAVVYKSYMDRQDRYRQDQHNKMVELLEKAFDELDFYNKEYLTYNEFLTLLQEARKYSYFRNMITPEYLKMKVWAMDLNNDGKIHRENFHKAVKVFRLLFDRLDSPTFAYLWFPAIAQTNVFQKMCKFVNSIYFEGFVFFGLLLVAVYTIASFWWILSGFKDIQYDDEIQIAIGIFFFVEAVFRIITYGWKKYMNKYEFDFVIMLLCLVPIILITLDKLQVKALDSNDPKYIPIKILSVFYSLQIPGVLRVCRILLMFPWFVMFYTTFVKMIGSSYKLVCLLFCFMYFFSVLGVQCFGGNKESTSDMDFTMNDILGGMLVMVELIETQEFDLLVKLQTQFDNRVKTDGATVFFIVTFNIIILICLNLVLSYVIDIFTVEFEREKISQDQSQNAYKQKMVRLGTRVIFQGECVELDHFESSAVSSRHNSNGNNDTDKGTSTNALTTQLLDNKFQPYEGLYCASLYKWWQQREKGGIEPESAMEAIFAQKVILYNNGHPLEK